MANGTKAAKLRKFFKDNPDATTKQAAEWANCGYGTAWSIKQEFCKVADLEAQNQELGSAASKGRTDGSL